VRPRADEPSGAGSIRPVLRGGSWNNNARNCRAAYRNSLGTSFRHRNFGFRVAVRLD
jgi:formylglycine-generating enzyme required for sulfatase activity